MKKKSVGHTEGVNDRLWNNILIVRSDIKKKSRQNGPYKANAHMKKGSQVKDRSIIDF